MINITRRTFTLGAAAMSLTTALKAAPTTQRILVGTGTEDGILAFDFDGTNGTLTPAGTAAKLAHPIWLALSPDKKYLYTAQELEEFQGKKTGGVASFHLDHGKLTPISSENSSGPGTCQLALDHTGRTILAVNYTGGSIAAFHTENGHISPIVYQQHYTGSGPVTDRQEAAHAHFASFTPDNRFAYVNDLGSDRIHIYRLENGQFTPAGEYKSDPGAGPRTLHFHPKLPIAYSINELGCSIDVLAWNSTDGSLKRIAEHKLPTTPGFQAKAYACDFQLSHDTAHAYVANRFDDYLLHYTVDGEGKLTEGKRTSCGGHVPRYFTLSPDQRWMLVANQVSGNLSVFARNPKTGELADTGTNIAAPTPMFIAFV